MPVRIVAIDYDPPGSDVQGEYILLRNTGSAAVSLAGWTLRDIAPVNPHVFNQFGSTALAPNGELRVWTKVGTNTATDLYWGLGAAVWNNAGDTAILRDASGTEIARFRYVPLPPGGIPLRLAVPAFWTLASQYQVHWQGLAAAGPVVSAVVIEGSWPQAAKNNPSFKTQAQAHLASLQGAVLGYVHTRSGPPNFDLIDASTVLQSSVQPWYDEFGGQIDGIYFDELVIPEKPADTSAALALVSAFKAQHPGSRAMILAGQCPDEGVVGSDVDWALLWEDRELAYRQNFAARTNGTLQPIPAWWRNPAHRDKIVHVVHDCPEPNRQHALGLANERNAGNVFVMDKRGLTPGGSDALYDHLPPYWQAEYREADSYYDFAFDPQRALLAAHRYGISQGRLHAWPNFEAAWYSSGHVRGTFLLDPGPHASTADVARSDLPGSPALYDVSRVWAAVHAYAQAQGFETALPTFELVQTPSGPGIRIVRFAKNLSWLTPAQAPLGSTYQQPTFAEPGSVVRNVGRWASSSKASFPTFVPDDPANPRGRSSLFNCYVLSSAAPVTWQDVPTPVYIDQL